jgi:protein phosphatase
VIVDTWARTDVGKKRTINEDNLFLDPEGELILVLDGMGGHRAGEIASRISMETVSTFYKKNAMFAGEVLDIFDNYDHSFSFHANLLRQAAFEANRVVLEESQEHEDCQGMGSTVVGMAIHGYTVSMINVGDTRMYMIRDGFMEQISRDHTLAEDQVERGMMTREEANESQLKHILSSVIGVDSRIRVHMDELVVIPGDIFLLCTDGLTAVMEDDEILSMVEEGPIGPELLIRFVSEVNGRGGPDNTTVALVRFEGEDQAVNGDDNGEDEADGDDDNQDDEHS